jgi:hypothetical protein
MTQHDVLTSALVKDGFDYKIFPSLRGKSKEEIVAAYKKYEKMAKNAGIDLPKK